jgi:chorismate mutase/prephenate dehydratase
VAARGRFGSSATLLPLPSFRDVVEETQKGNADYGLLPVENSTDGPLGETLDLMAESSLSICAETYVEVHHCLLSRSPLNEIDKVYSLPVVHRQCRGWIRNNLPNAQLLEAASTADAAGRAAKENGSAAIATAISAEVYGLNVVAENIEDLSHNRTRFAVLGGRLPPPTGKDKTSLLFSTKDEPGTLCRALAVFERAKLNLSLIQSRPDRRTPWQYIFFLDCAGHQADDRVQKALADLKEVTTYIKVLGSYPEGE